MNEYALFIGICCFFAGLLIAYLIQGRIASRKIRESEAEADRCIKESEKKAATLIKEAELEIKDRLFKLKNEFDAEEVLQDCFLKAFNSLKNFKGESKFSAQLGTS